MDASFHPETRNGLEADEARSPRRGNHSAAPTFDGLETRELLSVAHARLTPTQAERQAQLRARHDRLVAKVAAARQSAHLTTGSQLPPVNVTSSLGVSGYSPIGRVLAGRRRVGLAIQASNIPAYVLNRGVSTTPAPAKTTPAAVATTSSPATTTPTPSTTPTTNTTTVSLPVTTTTTTTTVATTPTSTSGSTPTSTGTTTTPSTPTSPSPQPVLSVAAATDRYKADLLALVNNSKVTPALLTALRGSYQAVENAAKGPVDPASARALQFDLDILDNSLPTVIQAARIQLDIAAVLESRGVTDLSLINKVVADADAVLAATNLGGDDFERLSADVQALRTAYQAQSGVTSSSFVTTSIVSTSNAPTNTTSAPAPNVAGELLAALYAPIFGTAPADSIRYGSDTPTVDVSGPDFVVPYTALLKIRPASIGSGTATETVTQGDPRPTLPPDRVYALTT